jgi:parallel beta-helix repeat protein
VQVAAGGSIQEAISAHGSGTKFCLHAGEYRLSAPLSPKAGDVIDGANGGAVLNGALLVTAWARAGATWYASGLLPPPYSDPNYDECEDAVENPCKLAEWMFRDDVALRRVMSRAAVVRGSFYADYETNRVYIGEEPTGHLMELSRTRAAIESTDPDVTIQNIVIEKFASFAQRGAVVVNADGWTVKNAEIRFNHGAGLYVYGNNFRVLNSHIHHNGMLGIGAHYVTGVIVDGNELDHNNTDGFWINDGENGGYKSTQTSDTVRNNYVHDNIGMGLWFDIDDHDNTIEHNTIIGNAADGIRYEISHGAVIRNNIVFGNGLRRGRTHGGSDNLYYGAGITSANAQGVEIYDNTVTGNDNGIGLVQQDRGAGIYGPRTLADNRVHDNLIAGPGGISGIASDTDLTNHNLEFVDNRVTNGMVFCVYNLC